MDLRAAVLSPVNHSKRAYLNALLVRYPAELWRVVQVQQAASASLDELSFRIYIFHAPKLKL